MVTRTKIFEKHNIPIADTIGRSRSWYYKKIRELGGQNITARKVMNEDKLLSTLSPGNLYLYKYDPKLKKQLPHYDTFPLVFPFDTYKGGFIGLNMHYLPIQLRMILLEKLIEFNYDTKINKRSRIHFNWQMLKMTSQHGLAKACVKRYLNNHVQTKFKKIPMNDWGLAMMLPVESFKKQTKSQVYEHSRRRAGL